MKSTWLAIAALPLLAACGGADEEEGRTLFANCVTVLSDAELTTELAKAQTSPDAACTCLQARVGDNGDEQAAVALFFSDLAGAMDGSDYSAEDLAGRLAARSILPREDGNDMTFAEALPVFNNVFEDLIEDMQENEGACPDI
ncbi:hypothetical protein WNY37_16075 [Henriciella sp. AS95]|uniref:hypothetical protein n=1 Tax=Henriciella sp. AS95 TaxID=3135782 RepID=UPI003170DDF5